MVGWHHWPDGHEFEQTLGDGEGQRSLVCCSPWARKELDMTERLNWSADYWITFHESSFLRVHTEDSVPGLLHSVAGDPSFSKALLISWGKAAKFQPSQRPPFPHQVSLLYLLKAYPWGSVDLELPQEGDWSQVPFPFLYYAGFHIPIQVTFAEEVLGIFMQGSPGKHLTAMDLSHGFLTLSKECLWSLTICNSDAGLWCPWGFLNRPRVNEGRRKWQPTPVFLPGESQGWGRTELDTTEVT